MSFSSLALEAEASQIPCHYGWGVRTLAMVASAKLREQVKLVHTPKLRCSVMDIPSLSLGFLCDGHSITRCCKFSSVREEKGRESLSMPKHLLLTLCQTYCNTCRHAIHMPVRAHWSLRACIIVHAIIHAERREAMVCFY